MKAFFLLPPCIFFFYIPRAIANPWLPEQAWHISADISGDDKILDLSAKELKEMKVIKDFLLGLIHDPTGGGDVAKANKLREDHLQKFKSNERYSRAKVYMHMIRFAEAATAPNRPNPERACNSLLNAVKAYRALENLGDHGEFQAKKVYKESLEIDLEFLKGLYNTDYARRKGFVFGEECPCNDTGLNEGGALHYNGVQESNGAFQPSPVQGNLLEPPTHRSIQYKWQKREDGGVWVDIPNESNPSYSPPFMQVSTDIRRMAKYTCQETWLPSNIIELKIGGGTRLTRIADTIQLPTGLIIRDDQGASYLGWNGESRRADNIIKLLRQMVNSGSLNTRFFEIRQLIDGDNRWIPGKNGVPYELTFRHDETFSTILFPVGEYVITDLDPKGAWDPYRKSMDMISTCIIKILDQFGGSAFQIMTQGMADAPTFNPKLLVVGYDDDFFKRIPVVYYTSARSIDSKWIHIGPRYSNSDLPELRGAFLARALLRRDFMKEHQDKVFMFKGRVTEKTDPKDRNASIVIWIDWDAANMHFSKHHGANGT